MTTRKDAFDQKDGWEAHRMAQLQRFRKLSLREKLEAVEGMADVARRFAAMRREGKFQSSPRPTGMGMQASESPIDERK
jgi:hypothetical protein